MQLIVHLEINLKRVQLLEKLRIIKLFCFRETSVRGKQILIDNKPKLQNRYVYEKIIRVIPADRVFVSDPNREGLPELP